MTPGAIACFGRRRRAGRGAGDRGGAVPDDAGALEGSLLSSP